MTPHNFNIVDLYQKAFGLTGMRFAITDRLVAGIGREAVAAGEFAAGRALNDLTRAGHFPGYIQNGFDSADIQTIPLRKTAITSVLGTPIFEQITLTIPPVLQNGLVIADEVQYTFPYWPLFDITGQNIIVKTPGPGRKGQIKEYITEDDSAITIRGFCINEGSWEYPEKQVQDLKRVINTKKALGITSQVINLLDIHNIVIESWSFPSIEGVENVQPFELQCTSDYPVELEIKSMKTRQPIVQGL